MSKKSDSINKLSINLVPKSCWYANVRSNVSKEDWDEIRRSAYKKADYKCVICGMENVKLEAHEIFEYDDKNHIQKLMDIVALCPECHEVYHIGLTSIKNRYAIALQHLAIVNNFELNEAIEYINKAFMTWKERSSYKWRLDLKYLETEYNIKDGKKIVEESKEWKQISGWKK
jgi:hypothetical protein